MTYSTLGWQIDDRVLTLTLNRPAQLNAFTVEMANELIDAYNRASDDDAVAAVWSPAPAEPSAPAWICRWTAMCSASTRA